MEFGGSVEMRVNEASGEAVNDEREMAEDQRMALRAGRSGGKPG